MRTASVSPRIGQRTDTPHLPHFSMGHRVEPGGDEMERKPANGTVLLPAARSTHTAHSCERRRAASGEQLMLRQFAIERRVLEKFGMGADGLHPPRFEDDDPIRIDDRREPMGDDENRTVAAGDA